MYGRAVFLDAHVVASAQDFAVCGYETGSDGHAAFRGTFLRFLEGGLEADVLGAHVDEN